MTIGHPSRLIQARAFSARIFLRPASEIMPLNTQLSGSNVACGQSEEYSSQSSPRHIAISHLKCSGSRGKQTGWLEKRILLSKYSLGNLARNF